MAPDSDLLELVSSVEGLLSAVSDISFPFATEETPGFERMRDMLIDQLTGYVIPRLNALDAPLLVVVGGSTGVGKSTLVNSMVGHLVSPSGVVRPTTRTPVLLFNPADAEHTAIDQMLPNVPRTDGSEPHSLRRQTDTNVPAGIMLLDAPDIDSVDAGNRNLADRLFNAADLWLFVVSAQRYADEVPWQHLSEAAERGAAVAVVLDRASADKVDPIRRHLARMMTARGLADSPLFTVMDATPNAEGLLPFEEVAQILVWLQEIAADPEGVQGLVKATLAGVIRHGVFRARDLADAIDDQIDIVEGLRERVELVYELHAGEVLDQVGKPGADLSALAIDGAERAGHDVVQAWLDDPAGRMMIEKHPELGLSAKNVISRVGEFAPGEQLRGTMLEAFGADAATFTALLPDISELRAAQEALRAAANRTDSSRLSVDIARSMNRAAQGSDGEDFWR